MALHNTWLDKKIYYHTSVHRKIIQKDVKKPTELPELSDK
jgi:hypothetical protein